MLVTDFGAGLDVTVHRADQELAGTPLYLAPEVLTGAAPSVQSDIYCLGVLLFHLLSASYPVTGRTLEEVWAAHREQRRQPLSRIRPDLDAGTVRVIERALAIDPANRYATAREMETALTAVASAELTVARRWARRGIAAAVTATVVVLGTWRLTTPTEPSDVQGQPVVPQRVLLPAGQIGVPSPDGRAVPYIDTSERAQIWDVATRSPRRLLRDDAGVVADADTVISPDGRDVAFVSWLEDETWELRVLESAGTARRPVIARQRGYRPVPQEWSRDRRDILCWLRQRNGTVDLALVPVDGGPPRIVHTFADVEPAGARLSPDGRYVAAVVGTRGQTARFDLLLAAVDGGEPSLLAEGVAAFTEPAWTADGSGVFHLRESTVIAGSRDGWIVPVANGRTAGAPTLTAANLGNVSWIRLLDSGLLGRIIWSVSTDVYTLPLDLAGAAPPGPPTRIAAGRVGNHVAPAWSPAGQTLAYFATRPAPVLGGVPLKTLMIGDWGTGEARVVPTALGFLGGYSPEWAADGRSVVVWGSDDGGDRRLGYYRIDLQSGAASEVVILGRPDPANSALARGDQFFYRDPDRGIVTRHLGTSRERVVAGVERGPLGWFRLAPDGRTLAYTRHLRRPEGWVTTLVVQPIDGAPRELIRVDRPAQLRVQAWTPAGDAVLYTQAAGDRPHQLWLAPATGSAPRNLGVSFIRSGSSEPTGLSLSADGRTIAYTERVVQSELWTTSPSEPGPPTAVPPAPAQP